MSFRSAALNSAATKTIILTIALSARLQKRIRALKTKIPSVTLLHGDVSMASVLTVLKALNNQWNNKKLSNAQKLTIDEYKLALIESCRDKLTQIAPIPFKVPKSLRSKLTSDDFQKRIPDLALVNAKTATLSIEQLKHEFYAVQSYLKDKRISAKDKSTLKEYLMFILHSPLYKQSGANQAYEETKHNESARKNFLRRFFFVIPQLLQIVSNGCLYLVELLGKSSLLALIPSIPNPVSLAVSISLIVVASVLDFAFGMKLFKDTYGISFFGQISTSNLTLCENQMIASKNINAMLANPVTSEKLDSASYSQYAQLASLLNTNIKNKTTKPSSEFVKHKEIPWLKATRWILLGLTALLTTNSAYFAGASLVALATGAALITPAGWLFIAALIAASLALLYLQQSMSTFSLLNPTFERFEKLKKKALIWLQSMRQTKRLLKKSCSIRSSMRTKNAWQQSAVKAELVAKQAIARSPFESSRYIHPFTPSIPQRYSRQIRSFKQNQQRQSLLRDQQSLRHKQPRLVIAI